MTEPTDNKIYSFANFELNPLKRTLLKNGNQIALNSKTFDLLLILVEHHGQILSKNELLERVWENQFVEENNLTVHISSLRKALGETKNENRFLVTVPGKGYKFVAELDEQPENDIVIENHSFSRIVVEETEGVENQLRLLNGKRRAAITISAAFAVLTAVLLIGTAALRFYSAANRNVNGGKAAVQAAEKTFVPKLFTTNGGIPHRVAISPDGKSLSYVQRLKGQDSIWLGDIATGNSVQVTPASERLHEHLSFSPDGKSLYFTARDDNHLIWTLMRVSIFGGAPQNLIADVHSSISFSPDSKQFAFLRETAEPESRASLIVADTKSGKNERVLIQDQKEGKLNGEGVGWSPDGKLIAVYVTKITGDEIWAINAETGTIEKKVSGEWRKGGNIVWQPDGNGLIALATSSESGRWQIWLVPFPDGAARKISDDSINFLSYSLSVSGDHKLAVLNGRVDPKIWVAEGNETQQILSGARTRAEGMHGLTFAPDGKILYTAKTGDSRTIWEMNADGANQRQLTPSQAGSNDNQVCVTADNRFIVIESLRSGENEIWRRNRDGSDLRQLTTGGGNTQPAVSPDGKWVIYTASKKNNSTLRRISIEGGEPTGLTKEEGFWAAVSPDGNFIAAADSSSADSFYRRISIYPFEGGKPIKTFPVAKHGVLYNRLRWTPDGQAIVYKDAVQGFWRQNLKADEPEQIKLSEDLRIYHFAYSAGGKLIYSGGVPMREIAVLENVF